MKKLIVIIALGCATLAGDALVDPPQARCSFCPTYPCYSSRSCGRCSCLKRGFGQSGECVSIE